MGGGDLALAGRAGEDEIMAVDDGGAANERNGWTSPPAASALPQSTATAVSVPSTAAGSWAAYLPDAVILPSTVPGLERSGGDGDGLAGVVAEGFPDEEAAGMRGLR